MTGYGRAEGSLLGLGLTVEVRSVNHRYTDVRLGLPREWLALEVEVERRVREGVGRGRVECSVRLGAGAAEVPCLDLERLRRVHQLYLDIARELALDERPTLGLLARTEGVLTSRGLPSDPGEVRAVLMPLLDQALAALDQMRAHEGALLQQEVEGLLQGVRGALDDVRGRAPEEQRQLAARVEERLRGMLAGAELSEERLLQELAVMAERADVTEELARLGAHLEHFDALLRRPGPVGRELDFLLQEMNREINTLCSKFHAADVVRLGVGIKAGLERIREQIQNVE